MTNPCNPTPPDVASTTRANLVVAALDELCHHNQLTACSIRVDPGTTFPVMWMLIRGKIARSGLTFDEALGYMNEINARTEAEREVNSLAARLEAARRHLQELST